MAAPPGYNRTEAQMRAAQLSPYLMSMASLGKKKYNYNRTLVRSFQRAAGIAVDGSYGGGTRGALVYFAPALSFPRPFFAPTTTVAYRPHEPSMPVPTAPPVRPAPVPALPPTQEPVWDLTADSGGYGASASVPAPAVDSPVYAPPGGGYEAQTAATVPAAPRRWAVDEAPVYVPPAIELPAIDTDNWSERILTPYTEFARDVGTPIALPSMPVYGGSGGIPRGFWAVVLGGALFVAVGRKRRWF